MVLARVFWVPQFRKDKLERIQRRSTKTAKVLETKTYEVQFKEPGMFSLGLNGL